MSFILLFSTLLSQDPADVARELKAYYEENKPPPWQAAVARLASPEPVLATRAADYLGSLLESAFQDERSGKAPWRATPWWGSSGENPARNLRESIVEALGERPPSPAGIAVLRWYFDREKAADFQSKAVDAVLKAEGRDADALLIGLASKPHPNSEVVVKALRRAADRRLPLRRETLASLELHHRSSIRAAAKTAREALGHPAPPPFDPAAAVQAEPLRTLLRDLSSLVLDPAPPGADFVQVLFKSHPEAERDSSSRGWRLKDEEGKISLFTPFGWRERFDPAEGARVVPVRIEDEVRRVAALRKAGDPEHELSERGGLSGQFGGRAASLYEILLGQWLHASKRFDLAATILLPAIDTLYLDEHFLERTRHRLGWILGCRMLVAFAGDRDYDRALRLAVILKERYPETQFHGVAEELSKELPRRREDFEELKLPVPKEWAELKRTLPREEQIRYLCDRLRLLNCFQWGQPGGVGFTDTQYAEPCGLARDASWGLRRGKTEVINPFVELWGTVERDDRHSGLALKVADIPALVPHLKEDWHTLAVEFWRDFHPSRTLQSTRPILERIINELARREICDPEIREHGLEKGMERIAAWAKENAHKAETELLLAAVEKAVTVRNGWYVVSRRARELVELRERKALPLLRRFLDHKDNNPSEVAEILSLCRRLDVASVKDLAERHQGAQDLGIRLQAGLILLKTGERNLALDIIGQVFAQGNRSNLSEHSIEEGVTALFEEGSEAARKSAALALAGDGRAGGWSSSRISLLKVFLKSGSPEPYRFYLRLLGTPGKSAGGVNFSEPVSEVFAKEILTEFAPDDPEIVEIKKQKDPGPALQEWLKKRIQSLEK